MKTDRYPIENAWRHGLALGLLLIWAGASLAGEPVPLKVPASGKIGFTLLPATATGIGFTNRLADDRHLTNQILLNGSGVAAGDVDGDGWCDLYFCGLDGANVLYRNLGNWKFDDVTKTAGVSCMTLDATGAVLADIDGDGDLDLIVNSVGGGTHVYLNEGKGRFTASPGDGRMNRGLAGMSLALADMDGDGDLDLYVTNYRVVTLRDQPNTRFTFKLVDGKPAVTAIDGRAITEPDLADRFNFRITMTESGGNFAQDENGEADVLYRNDGKGGFTPVAFTNGVFIDERGLPLDKPPFDWGLSVMFRDLNGDGAPELYVCNDFKSPDRIWINDGKGRFQAIAPLAIRQTPLSSMGVDVADINRDGHDDIFVVDMLSRDHVRRLSQRIDIKPELLPPGAIANRPQYPRNALFLNRGDGSYAEVAQLSGLEASEWSWTPIFLDVDLDGYEDVLISNGFERDGMNVDVLRRLEAMKKEKKLSSVEQLRLRKIFPRLDTGKLAFRNQGNLKFAERSAEWGFDDRGIAHGMALADLDNDGDLDVVVNNLHGPAGIYRNDTVAPRVAVRLKGLPPNTRGIGAKIRMIGGPVPQSQEMICGGRYLSGDDAMRVFACGTATDGLSLEVTWRSGTRSVVTNVQANRLYEIEETSAVFGPPRPVPTVRPPHFQDASGLIAHSHAEEPFDDFAQQPALPNRLSQLGPSVAWFDVDGDGWEDLIIGSGRGGQLAVCRNDGRGGFRRLEGPPFNQSVTRDQTTVLGWRTPAGRTALLAGSANYEDGLTNGSVVRQYDLAGKTVTDALPGHPSSTGPLALADIDGDGDLDLFVGGRAIAGRYPEPASSLLFRAGADGKWMLDQENTRRLSRIGLVSGAVFSDFDGDGAPELILACDWGPLKIFRNQEGKLIAWDAPVQLRPDHRVPLASLTGWWNGVTTGDFDGDGRLDIIASNWGQNTRYESFRHQPLHLFHGDLDGNGTVEVIEGYLHQGMKAVMPLQPFHLAAAAMPLLRERLPTYESYARASLEGIYGASLKGARELQVNWLETTIFLNRGDHFEARVLPVEAQMAPAFAVCAGDLDGDGYEDVFLSQNFFATQPETSRHDAGRGLWLRGDGKGGFAAVSGQDSGLKIYGEQRGAALCDYDGDGRMDLAVTQNGAETKLYRNVAARPGLRVRLNGSLGNPHGVGATIRLVAARRMGPAREVRAGSGYWSQDSSVQVLPAPESPAQIWVRWPGGKTTTSEVPSGANEIAVAPSGAVKVLRSSNVLSK